MDNASSLGAGAPVVAQNDKDLAVRVGAVELRSAAPAVGRSVGASCRSDRTAAGSRTAGCSPSIVGDWTATLALTLQSGTPLTARVLGAASDVSRGTNGSLRADYDRRADSAEQSDGRRVLQRGGIHACPRPGTFGDSARNTIIGPGARQLNGMLMRDVRLGGNRVLTLQVNATNLLNTVQWASVDTNVNSPTFGQVLSVRPMRTVTLNVRFRF